MASDHTQLHTHTHTTLDRTPLDEESARRKDFYLTRDNIPKRQKSIPPAEFEPIIPVSKGPQTRTLDHAATGIGVSAFYNDRWSSG